MGKTGPKKNSAAPPVDTPISAYAWAVAFVIAILQAVCPLLFFTNLDRNPYYTQIALLNIGIVAGGLLWAGRCSLTGQWRLPRVPFEIPLAAFLSAALLSTVHSWIVHSFVRSGIAFEAVRVWEFTLVNCVLALFLPLFFVKPLDENSPVISIWTDLFLALIWGALWLFFREPNHPDPHLLLWDTYGAFLWALAIVYGVWRARRLETLEIFHIIFAAGVVAALYGILQYFGRDIIWSSPIQPYGGRPVSTFGNPNFLSSHLMLIIPVALALAVGEKGAERWGYVTVAAICASALVCTLTRSSYLGLMAALLALGGMGLALRERAEGGAALKNAGRKTSLGLIGGGLVAVVLLIVLFPHTPVSNVQSPLARFTEVIEAMKTGSPYAPWHQRLLIWSSAWEMVKERPILGKGWGAFELFYPFYQGKFLLTTMFPRWRTHANNAHNVLLELWSQTGSLGVGLALWMMVTLAVGGWFTVVRQAPGKARFFSAGLLAGLAGMLTDNFFGNVSIFFAVPAFLFWWNMGALYNQNGSAVLNTGPVSATRGRPALVLFAAGCLAVTAYFCGRWMQEFYYFQGFKESKNDQVIPSIKSLESAYHWFPGEVNSNYEMGNSYSRHAKMLREEKRDQEAQEFYRKAAWAYQAALDANPGYDEIHFNLGITYLNLGDQADGERCLRMAVFINPLLMDAYASLGNLYMTTGRYKEGRDLFLQGIAVDPNNKDFWNNLGYAYSQLGQDDKSTEAYRHALSIDPTFQQAWHNLSVVSAKTGKHDPLLDVPNLIAQMNDLVHQKRYAEAKNVALKIENLLPDNADVQLSVGNILFFIGERENAAAHLRKAIALRPQFSAAHSNLAQVYLSLGKRADAEAELKSALEIDPNNADAKSALAALNAAPK